MIKINGTEMKIGHYPDHTQAFDYAPYIKDLNLVNNTIGWYYDNDEEIYTVASIADWIRRYAGRYSNIVLEMPYTPYARMDRVKGLEDNASLKVFARLLNSIEFSKVKVYNIHSTVGEGLIDYIDVEHPDEDVQKIIDEYDPDVVFFPDEGACKRYSDLYAVKESDCEIGFGIKKRVFRTNEILGLDVIADFDIKDKKVLIIDDICSAGGTFKFSAKKLKELGASEVRLYVSHCEDNIQNGDLLKTDLISKIYTTDSILHITNPKIEVIRKYR